ncbi:MAG: bifunctional molybdenum cofactor guanylyltransferase MobA/molybdopterin-guanine dinucleotide biosynthesis adaptor protein MobB [Bdellovibrionaceae bacterium]|nr:bifunctional molybdenum cofactor guanylyltransferase MobA/molybdopterin-guanine dinucleotide biosynthesis adaptor protein MobB [Pseudobdellovibrionaceae bacterium]
MILTKQNSKPKKRPPQQSDYLYHPYELSVCGYSNSGKTTLLEKVIKRLSSTYDIAFLKHDVHKFEMDKKGKDTQRMWGSGAKWVSISDKTHNGTLSQGQMPIYEHKSKFLDADFALLEGYKNLNSDKVVVIDSENKILRDVETGHVNNVICFVGQDKAQPVLPLSEVPYFHRDQVTEVSKFIENYFVKKAALAPLYGLVLTGGRSQRMKKDKALLNYNGQAQALEVYNLLSEFCGNTFISARKDQWNDTKFNDYPQITDRFLNMGPAGGILSAQWEHPKASFLVVACDLPFLEINTINNLLSNRNPFKLATCYLSQHFKGMPEPLCSVYEPKSFHRIMNFMGLGYTCPRKALINSPVKSLELLESNALENVNYPAEFEQAVERLSHLTI